MVDEKKTPQQIASDLLARQINDTVKKPVIKKEAKTNQLAPPKAKLYYDVRIETMLPATLTYRVLAEDAQQASELIKGMSPIGVKHKLIGKKDIKLTVYKAGSSFLEWSKNLLGR